jgi:hypothetical protein
VRGALAIATVAVLVVVTARAAGPNDLRDFRVGMPVSALPESGYTGFACAADAAVTVSGWQDWRKCPADPSGRHAVSFRYRDGETEVAGHPVLLTLLLSEPGLVKGLRIETDPTAPLYLRKKAFLLGLQARSHYGEEGWACSEGTPNAAAEPIGGTFIMERCEKRLPDRHVIIERSLFRHPYQPLKNFVDTTHILILSTQ